MAVSYLGAHANVQIQATSGNFNITIPATCDPTNNGIIIVSVTGYPGSTDTRMFSSLYLESGATDADFTLLNESYYSASLQVQVANYYLLASHAEWPGEGSQALYWVAPGRAEGFNIQAYYFNGVDQTSPIGSSDGGNYWTTGTFTSSFGESPTANDMSVVSVYSDVASPVVDGNSQTEIVSSTTVSGAAIAIGYKAAESGMQASPASSGIVPSAFWLSAATTVNPEVSYDYRLVIS